MTERFEETFVGKAAGGEKDFIGEEEIFVVEEDFELALFVFAHTFSRGAETDFDIEIASSLLEAFDDGDGFIGYGEHATIGFCLEFDTTGLKPLNGVLGTETIEGADELTLSARIMSGEKLGILTVVSDVATSPTRYTDLCE